MKQRHKFESIVAETLLIPLYYRAKESRRKNPILNDKVAEGWWTVWNTTTPVSTGRS